jgi:uncharacterized protein YutE (UPF0331/DUF86 family)
MTDLELAAKKLAEIETYVEELRTLGQPALVVSDLRERRFIEHRLQLAIQACLDVSSHIASDERLGEPETYADLFTLLAARGHGPEGLVTRLRRMAGIRNLLVHNYAGVKPEIVAAVATHDVTDLLEFVAALRVALHLSCRGPAVPGQESGRAPGQASRRMRGLSVADLTEIPVRTWAVPLAQVIAIGVAK